MVLKMIKPIILIAFTQNEKDFLILINTYKTDI